MNSHENESAWKEEDVIFSYTRRQAIEDGVLIEVPECALKRVGIRYPMVITRNLWQTCIGPMPDTFDVADELVKPKNDEQLHRLASMLYVFSQAARSPRGGSDLMTLCLPDLDEKPVEVWSHCGPGDTPDPVLTLMLPEDY